MIGHYSAVRLDYESAPKALISFDDDYSRSSLHDHFCPPGWLIPGVGLRDRLSRRRGLGLLGEYSDRENDEEQIRY
jgi:hypothetical protein